MSDSRTLRVIDVREAQGGGVRAEDSRATGIAGVPIQRVSAGTRVDALDAVAVEEPLEIRLDYELDGRRTRRSLSITMRTPGHDRELAAGFLLAEGIVHDAADILSIAHCGPPVSPGLQNVIKVELRRGVQLDLPRIERHSYTSSSCGVCGKTSIEALEVFCPAPLPSGRPAVSPAAIGRLPLVLREAQQVFDTTGGLHAAALFTPDAKLVALREDVGRHNAVDKVIGSQLLAGLLPRHDVVMLVSGRASFELVQKALIGGIAVLAAVGAPSSLAIELAVRFDLTLLGFVRDGRFNIYSGAARVAAAT